MPQTLPKLRSNLDFMPSPVEERPGLLIRDPYYSDTTLIIPPLLVACLELFDGQATDLDLRELLVRMTGELEVGDIERHLADTLSASGFLEDEVFADLREARHSEFRAAQRREAAHVGSAYPADVAPLRTTMERYMGDARSSGDSLIGIAAPHVSPEGGWQSYRAAYAVLGPQYAERTFVVLGTSHYGPPERFGLTRKPFVTPFGEALVDHALVEELERAAGDSIEMEDYCHSIEHSIEFQVLFLQHLYGPSVRILPVLCGSYATSIFLGGKPEANEHVARFLDALGNLGERHRDRLFWVLGIDMSHMGRRYNDRFHAVAMQGPMEEVSARDRRRIDCINAGDADGFWALVQENRDDLKWCGSSPLYTFLKTAPRARGNLLRYEQWNIDAQSVVSFAGLSFSR